MKVVAKFENGVIVVPDNPFSDSRVEVKLTLPKDKIETVWNNRDDLWQALSFLPYERVAALEKEMVERHLAQYGNFSCPEWGYQGGGVYSGCGKCQACELTANL